MGVGRAARSYFVGVWLFLVNDKPKQKAVIAWNGEEEILSRLLAEQPMNRAGSLGV